MEIVPANVVITDVDLQAPPDVGIDIIFTVKASDGTIYSVIADFNNADNLIID